jgi:hypothetical protein
MVVFAVASFLKEKGAEALLSDEAIEIATRAIDQMSEDGKKSRIDIRSEVKKKEAAVKMLARKLSLLKGPTFFFPLLTDKKKKPGIGTARLTKTLSNGACTALETIDLFCYSIEIRFVQKKNSSAFMSEAKKTGATNDSILEKVFWSSSDGSAGKVFARHLRRNGWIASHSHARKTVEKKKKKVMVSENWRKVQLRVAVFDFVERNFE